MKPLLRTLLVLGGAPLLLGGDCLFGRPIVDERSRYFPSDGVIDCTGTLCTSLPAYELELPPPLDDSPCAQDLPAAELAEAAQTGTVLTRMRYRLASERPLEVNLGTLDLREACVELSGPVRLTLEAGSKLTHVTIMLGPAKPSDGDSGVKPGGRATPNLYLGHAELDRVVLKASEDDAPSGSAQIEFSTGVQCEIRIDSLNVTESHMQNSRLGAGSLTMVGGAFDTVELAFDYALLAGVLGNNLRTAACNTLSLVGTTIAGRASQIGPCDCTLSPPDPVADAGNASDAGEPADSGHSDAGPFDASQLDANAPDAAVLDAETLDARLSDAEASDARPDDAEPLDAEPLDGAAPDGAALEAAALDADEAPGAGEPDAGLSDAGAADAGEADAGSEAGAPDATGLDVDERDAGEANAACNGITISQSMFFAGMVDGKIHAENSTFRSVLFARHAPTSLDMWNVDIELSVVCDQRMDMRLDETSAIGCTSCDSAETATACTLDRTPELIVNECKSFRGKLSPCEPPLPARRAPFVPRPPKLGQ
jgi:hypothetical protein